MEAKLFDSIVKSGKGLAVDFGFDRIVESIFSEFPLRGWRAYLLACLIMIIYERDSTAIEILDEDDDTRSKEAHEIIAIDANSRNV